MAMVYKRFYPPADYADHWAHTGQHMEYVTASVYFVLLKFNANAFLQVFSVSWSWEPNKSKYAYLFIYFAWQVHRHSFKI